MCPYVEEASFLEEKKIPLLLERRRTISEILPPEREAPGLSHAHWPKIACLIGSATLIGAQSYLEYRAPVEHNAMPSLALGGMSLYRWFGFHRVAP